MRYPSFLNGDTMNPNIHPIQLSELNRIPRPDPYIEKKAMVGCEPYKWADLISDIYNFYFEGRSPVDLRKCIEDKYKIEFTPRFYLMKILRSMGAHCFGYKDGSCFHMTAEEQLRILLYPLAGHLEKEAASELERLPLYTQMMMIVGAEEKEILDDISKESIYQMYRLIQKFYPELETEDLTWSEDLPQLILELYCGPIYLVGATN